MPWKPTAPRRRDLRPPSNQRGYGYAHRQWRAKVLKEDPYCRDPFGRHPDVLVPATVADHLLPVSQGGEWTLENAQSLCQSCHNAKSAQEGHALR
jgi:5-methylcytosine-specific restriction protein A